MHTLRLRASLAGIALLLLSFTANAQLTTYTVTGGGSICSGDPGADVALSGSDVGVNYQLYDGSTAVGSVMAGTGSPLDFGLQSAAGTYTVVGNPGDVTETAMSGAVTVAVNPLPNVYTVAGGGSFCSGGSGADVALGASDAGINYQLYVSGSAIGASVAGSGSSIDFGLQTVAGSYTVVATDGTSGCTSSMSGSATVTAIAAPNAYSIAGGGNFCAGGSGVDVSLSASDAGINYQLYNGSTPEGGTTAGTGSSLDFGLQVLSGSYTVVATDPASSCTSTMSGSATVTSEPLPSVYLVSGGGSYCSGGSGADISMNMSDYGINYQLYNGASPVGSALGGNGSVLDFGNQPGAGTYTVVATDGSSGCTSNMNGAPAISIIPAPSVYDVTGGGAFCTGGSGYDVALDNSDAGVSYQLSLSGSPLGAPLAGVGSSLDFGIMTSGGIYTVIATDNTTGCTSPMNGSASITVYSLPVSYTLTGGGPYCSGSAGADISLASSATGVNYQLFNGAIPLSIIAGSGATLDFGPQTAAGSYEVIATDAVTGCSSTMPGIPFISINPLPAVYTVSGGGIFCAGTGGADVTLSQSDNGFNYQLYNGATPVGSALAGTGSALDFGLQTSTGSYTVVSANATTGCTITMTGSASVTANPLPNPYNMSGGGAYCTGGTGVDVSLANSDAGISYELYFGSMSFAGPFAGTGSPLDFGLITTPGIYTVIATDNTTGCTNNMTGTAGVAIYAFPALFSVSGGGSYCLDGSGVDVGLDGSAVGTVYQLYNSGSPVGSALSGTGSSLDFGLQTAAGSYNVVAINGGVCNTNMAGVANITISALPNSYAISGGGDYCAGGTGVDIALSGSDPATNYYLYSGTSLVGAAAGTGSPLDFGLQTSGGMYSVVATAIATGCSGTMSGSATISIDPLPGIFNVSGGGDYCAGGSGVGILLSGSETGATYSLMSLGMTVSTPLSGSGSALDFSSIATPGNYTVSATSAHGCTAIMNGSASVSIDPLPATHTITGGGGYCAGGAGVHIGLNGSDPGVSYQLTMGGSPVTTLSGTGTSLDFGALPGLGTYTVLATNLATTCATAMAGTVSVNINPAPNPYNVVGGGNFCSGGAGLPISLDNSDPTVNYQLFNGTAPVGSTLPGTGLILGFGLQATAGNYTVVATDAVTGCSANMNGIAPISINPLPVAFSVTGGGGFCPAGTGVNIGINGSSTGVSYQLYLGGSPVGSPVAGSEFTLSFGLQTTPGTYTVQATNSTTACTNSMSGTATVSVNPAPAAYSIIGGGSFCTGGAGVDISLNGSDAGTLYQMYIGTSPYGTVATGTGSSIDFGTQSTAGSYTIRATNPLSGCTATMPGGTVISLNTPPSLHTITGGGNYCPGGTGVHIGLNGSAGGVNYQLFNGATATGSPVSGTGTSLDFGLQAAPGTYNVVATDATTGCTIAMTGYTPVGFLPVPVVYSVTGGGGYCVAGSGLDVSLTGSETGVNYQLYNSGVAIGTLVPGNGMSLDFGSYVAGVYSVVATNTTTTCSDNMNGNAVIATLPLPEPFAVTGGGSYCSGGDGQHLYLGGSETGVAYQVFLGGVPSGSSLTGTGSPLDFGLKTSVGTYSITATNLATGCSNTMSGTAAISVNPGPTGFAVSGGGTFCASGTGVHVYLNNSNAGVTYQLHNGGTAEGVPLSGTGSALDFGLQVLPGTYSIVGTDAITGCSAAMSGTAAVTALPLPAPFSVLGGGNYCAGSPGVHISLASSATGITYQLSDGGTITGATGTGAAIDFGLVTGTGTYTVAATNTLTGCTNGMSGSASVSVSPLPVAYPVSSSGTSYCSGGTGVSIGLTNSQAGVAYQLYVGTIAAGSPVPGTLSLISFGTQTTPGTYTVVATDLGSGCTAHMLGAASVAVNTLPVAYTVTGGGGYCSEGTGVHIGLSGSAAGISYQLYHAGLPLGSPVDGTGSAIDMGLQTLTGTYKIVATNLGTTCFNNMTGTSVVSINPLPADNTVTGGGSFCPGGTGVHVSLSGSNTGITYQLYRGTATVGSAVSGSGMSLDFGLQDNAGTYTVNATNPATGCQVVMSGSAAVSLLPLPAAYTVSGGGTFCTGGAGEHVGISGSESGASYQLYNGAVATGTSVPGTGTALDFGLESAAGVYTVIATSATTSCSSTMPGSALLAASPLPVIFSVTGGGSFCAGSTGMHVGLTSSAPGVTYNLNAGGVPVASAGGSGSVIDFGPQTTSGLYTVIATDPGTGCSVSMGGSAVVTATAVVAPSVTITSGAGFSFCASALATLSASTVNGGSTPVYQWTVNGVPTGSGPSYIYLPLNGDVVGVSVTSNAACAEPAIANATASLTVLSYQYPYVSVSANPGTEVCQGTSVTYSAYPSFGGTAPAYEWQINGMAAASGPEYAYTPANGDVVTCKLSSNYQCLTSATATSAPVNMMVDVAATPVVAINAYPGLSIAAGESETLNASVTNGGPAPVYQWLVNGMPVPGAVYPSYTSNNFADGDVVTCEVTSSGGCGGINGSTTVTITVSNVGVKPIQAGTNSIYILPNPNNGLFTITGNIGAGDEEVSIEVTNMLGQLVYSGSSKLQNGAINEKVQLADNITNGMYILTMRNGNELRISHVVVSR